MKKILNFLGFVNENYQINEAIQLSDTHAFSYMKLVAAAIGAKTFEVVNNITSQTITFNNGFALLVKDNAVIGFSNDKGSTFTNIPKTVKTFKDLVKQAKMLNKDSTDDTVTADALVSDNKIASNGSVIDLTSAKLENDAQFLKEHGISELKDGLTVELLTELFPWILQASINGAVIGYRQNVNLIWYSGTWLGGTWEDGIWQDGTWQRGIWHNGVWEDGIWQDGTWERGAWQGGIWQDGTWERGAWENGTWKKGTWKSRAPHPNGDN